MTYSKALKILIQRGIIKNPVISELSSGNNYQSFLIVDNNYKYVLRLPLKKSNSKNRLEKAYLVLKFVENEGFDFSEKAVFFDKKNSFLLSTYISGKEVSIRDLTQNQLSNFIGKIIDLKKLNFNKFNNLQKKNKLSLNILENPVDRLSLLKKERVKFIKKNKKVLINNQIDFSDLICWIDNNFSFLQNFYKTKKYKKADLFFDHGDVAGANIIINKNNLFFIDWDNAKFTHDLGFSLANILFYSGNFSKKFIDEFLSLYFKKIKTNINKKIFLEEFNFGFKLIVFSGVLWSLESFIKSIKNDDVDCEKYFVMYKERLRIYNKL